ncbi:MAG: hypothetical protein QG657_1340 [Acidobacteriota bacterium]|nr:hypothetical protein [Acidobacteriota bacterium]
MNGQKITKKLILRKETIAHLGAGTMRRIFGGDSGETQPCHCIPYTVAVTCNPAICKTLFTYCGQYSCSPSYCPCPDTEESC